MARAFRQQGHTDHLHTPVREQSQGPALSRRRPIEPIDQQQHPSGGRELRYRGVSYDVY